MDQRRPVATRVPPEIFEMADAGAANTALQVSSHQTGEIVQYTTRFTPSQLVVIRNTYAKDLNDDEFVVFIYQAERRGLDPTNGQIFAVKYKDRMVIQTGIAGFRLIAQRTGRYRGRMGPLWCGDDGVWKDVWLAKEHPAAAKVGARSLDNPEGSWNVALWDEYVGRNRDGKVNEMWSTKGVFMIAKCAEGGILRAEFPEELSGLYLPEEMDQKANPPQIDRPAEPRSRSRTPEPPAQPAALSPLEQREMSLWRAAKDLNVPIPELPQGLSDDRRSARCDWLEARIEYRKLTIVAERDYQIPGPKLAERASLANIQEATAALQRAIDAAPKPVGTTDELFPT